ncbi:molecular chaperone GrpE [Kwoniella heveanensis CBS 569]|nr:molecular chaperone GrpE [Kwoniella heveanensis CBS 569]
MNPRTLTAPLRSLRSSIPLRPAAVTPRIAAIPVARLNVARTYSASADAGKEDKFHAEEDKRISELENAKKESDKKAEELAEQIKELKKEIQYVRADYQTAVRRAAEDKVKNSEMAIASFARALLGTVDILSTALRSVPQPIEHQALKQLYDGVELTQKALIQTFGQHKMKRIENLQGQQFDPNYHEAEFMIPKEVAPKRADGEPHGPGEIMQVNSEGWLIGDRVLRPAKVGVVQPE